MSFPGMDILQIASSVIDFQTVTYYTFQGNVTNEIGMLVPSFDAGVAIMGSFQAVPKSMYTQYGLDLDKTYATFYATQDSMGVARNRSGDQLIYAGTRYQCESPNDWYHQDGWTGIIVSQIDD